MFSCCTSVKAKKANKVTDDLALSAQKSSSSVQNNVAPPLPFNGSKASATTVDNRMRSVPAKPLRTYPGAVDSNSLSNQESKKRLNDVLSVSGDDLSREDLGPSTDKKFSDLYQSIANMKAVHRSGSSVIINLHNHNHNHFSVNAGEPGIYGDLGGRASHQHLAHNGMHLHRFFNNNSAFPNQAGAVDDCDGLYGSPSRSRLSGDRAKLHRLATSGQLISTSVKHDSKRKQLTRLDTTTSQVKSKAMNFSRRHQFQCTFCFGKACAKEQWRRCKDPIITGLHSNMICDRIIGSQRPSTRKMQKYNIIEQMLA